MEKKWTFCAVCSIIQIQFVRGIWEDITSERENIYALPGSDVNLTCQLEEKSFLVQMQWSKVTNKTNLIAVYHPQHGFHCASGSPCESLVTFLQTPRNVTKWTLHLRNISSSLSGKYKCSFTLYPDGIRTRTYNLLVQAPVPQDEWRKNRTIEIEINQTLEIPCFQNISSEILSESTFAWLVEDNDTLATVITRDHHISNSTSFTDRVKLGADYRLHLSLVQIHDDDRKFSCHVGVKPGTILKSSTTVKVFAKPEIPMVMENKTVDVLGKSIFTCSLNKVFPKANISWIIDGQFLQGDKEELHITNEERKDKNGFLELKSVLKKSHSNKPAQSNNLTIWCIALFPVPGNKVWNTSSEKITFSLGSVNIPTDSPFSVTESTLGTQPSPTNSAPLTRYPAMSSMVLIDVNTSKPHSVPQTSSSGVTHQVSSDSWTSRDSWTSTGTDAKKYDAFTGTMGGFSKILTTANRLTANQTLHATDIVVNKPEDGMSWPVIVAALLSSCVLLFGLGLRKWCQYQREIMERPPPFKPPPPPIMYTCIQEPLGSDLPCHEMETL
ncbi:PREDICTED: T-cell surface protein tactile isoform X2 [Chinchilla lanigera]|uniref:T-cell surface protein tactile isoform X2 n=1 Tax=Chinchilla lanigera TaxID=34839 RepID=UPI000697DA2D|nr:PREDICTED: T-cell surface protein tactile isoform X2 [Chinchilla lanigera]